MSIKKTIITTVLALALVALVAPTVTQADALSDALAQLAQLQAQLAGLQGTTNVGGTGACAGVTFTRILTVGSTGLDVKCLQQILSVTPMSGYFGPITLAAVRAYQTSKGWTPANQVGPMTMAALNASIAGGTPPPAGLPAGCTSTSGYSVTTGLACSGGVLPVGCTSTSGYSSSTGLPCSGGSTPVVPGTPTEGFITITALAASPASNANIITTSNIPVLGVNIKAVNSNITVGSAKVKFDVQKAGPVIEHPATLINKIYVYDGATLLNTYPVSVDSFVKTGTDYYAILSGINFMIPAGQTKALTISADFNAGLETDRILTVNLYGADAVRGTDTLGLNSTATLATTRVYTIKYATVGSSTLTVTENTGTPVSTSVNVDVTDGATNVPMLVFNAKSTTGASKLTDVVLTLTGIDDVALNRVTAVKLYDGLTLLGSVSLGGVATDNPRTATFTDLSIPVAKDATKNLLVRIDIASGVDNLDTLDVAIDPATGIIYEQPDLSTGVGAGVLVQGKTMYVFDDKSASVSFVSGTAAYTYNETTPLSSYTTGIITIKVKADGGLLTKPVPANFDVYYILDGVITGLVDSQDVTVTPNANISDGSEATVVINANVTQGTSGTGFVAFKLGDDLTDGFDWTIDALPPVTQFWGFDDFKTPSVNVQ